MFGLQKFIRSCPVYFKQQMKLFFYWSPIKQKKKSSVKIYVKIRTNVLTLDTLFYVSLNYGTGVVIPTDLQSKIICESFFGRDVLISKIKVLLEITHDTIIFKDLW